MYQRERQPVYQWKVMIIYLRIKIEQRDWHAVSDAANDLREMEADYPELRNKKYNIVI
jgi:hypothetical protein